MLDYRQIIPTASVNQCNIQVGLCPRMWYLRRLRAVGVTEAVGEEDDRESGEEAALIAMREVDEVPSVPDMSLFISSLLRRDTAQDRGEDYKLDILNDTSD